MVLSQAEVVECLEELGRRLGFEVAHDPQKNARIREDDVELGRVDVVWFKKIKVDGLPSLNSKVIIVAFEVHGLGPKSNKGVKGDLLNLYWSNAPLQVYVVPLKYLKSIVQKHGEPGILIALKKL